MIGLYFLLILSCMYLLRDPSQGYQMQFLPLYGLAEHSLLQKELLCDVGTFLMFVLVGILFRAQYRGEYSVIYTVMFSFGSGFVIEVLQYLLKMGVFCIEDMVCAALGGLVGAWITIAWQKTQGEKNFGGILLRVLFGVCSFVFVLGLVTFGTYHVLRMNGEKNMQKNI